MTRDPLARMDVDTMFAYHHKLRKLQMQEPQQWPTYWTAYLVLLGECWRAGSRSMTLEESWCPAIPSKVSDAKAALVHAGIVDKSGRVPVASWREWYGPAEARIRAASEAGQLAAHKRWHVGPFETCQPCRNGTALRPHNDRNAPRQPPTPPTPPKRARASARGNGLHVDSQPTSAGATLAAMGVPPPDTGGKRGH